MVVINPDLLKGVIGKPPFSGGGGAVPGSAKLFTHLVTAGEETANTITLTSVIPSLTVALSLLIQRINGDVVHPGTNGITSITPSGSDIIIVFNAFVVFEDDIVLAMEGATA